MILIGLAKLKSQNVVSDNKMFVSVVVPFRNESNTILDNLRSLEQQTLDQDSYEIIYVDDQSTDDSFSKINSSIAASNIFVYSLSVEHQVANKKYAIEYGTTKAKGEVILLTDADCTHEPEWIESMLSSFDKNTALVSGPVKYQNCKTVFQKLQQIEFAGLILTGAGLIGTGDPIICSSANLAFRKEVFTEVGGYNDLRNLSSGDDDLLLQKISNETDYKIKFNISKEAIVSTFPNSNISSFKNQRKRWASKGLFYQKKTLIIRLIFVFLFYLGLVIQPILGLMLDKIFFLTFALCIVSKPLVEYFILRRGKGILFDQIPLYLFLMAEFFHIPYILYSSLAGAFGNFEWKNRKLKR